MAGAVAAEDREARPNCPRNFPVEEEEAATEDREACLVAAERAVMEAPADWTAEAAAERAVEAAADRRCCRTLRPACLC